MKRLPFLLSLLAVIALTASVAYWALQLYKPQQRPLAATPLAAMPEPSVDAAATLFGGQAAAAVATNYQLTGVVAAGRDSVAIIVADASPPKAVRLGREVVSGVTVKEVYPRYVMLSDGGVMKRIDLATDAHAGTSLSPPPNAGAGAAAPQQQGAQPGTAPGAVVPPPVQPVQMPPPTRPVVSPGSQPPNE